MNTHAEGVLGRAERSNPGKVVIEFIRVGSAALRKVAGAPQRSITAAYADSGQARIKRVGATIHDAGQWISARINKNLRGIQAGVLDCDKGLVTGEAEASLIQNTR